MNETMNTIFSRRSIRSYQRDQLKGGQLEQILEAGKFAPSGINQQPWHFTVVQNTEMLERINAGCKKLLQRSDTNLSVLYKAPTLIIVSGDKKAITPQYDCTLALGNMFLAAASLGIGSCWIHAVIRLLGSDEGRTLKSDLKIPDNYIVYSSGVFGYMAGELPEPAPRKENTVTFI